MSPKVIHNHTGIEIPEESPWIDALCNGDAQPIGSDVRAGYTITN